MHTSKLKLINSNDVIPAIVQGVVGRKGVTHLSNGKPTFYIGVEGVSAAVSRLKKASGVDDIPSSLTNNGGEAYYFKAVGADETVSKELENLLAGDTVLAIGYFKKGEGKILWFNVNHIQLLHSVDVEF